jgi:protein-L-isoaspartate(D-aspartate) O-methyltransferase
MVENFVIARGIKDERVINALLYVPRHIFVEEALQPQSSGEYPLPIGRGQTISQPYMVAFMCEALGLGGTEKVLEIGSGSGYQSAVLSRLAERVFAVERIHELVLRAKKALDGLMCPNVVVRLGDGTLGWKEEAPFDAIIAAAHSPEIPPAYIEQLDLGGRLVLPVGDGDNQDIIRITKKPFGIQKEVLRGCNFVKLIGRHGWKDAT